MIEITKTDNLLLLKYKSENNDSNWVANKLKKEGEVRIGKVFHFMNKNLYNESPPIKENSPIEDDPDCYVFILGRSEGEYYTIKRSILRLKYDLRLYREMRITKKTFIAEGQVSIFKKINELIDEPITIGGTQDNTIPLADFEKLLKIFPTRTTLKLYASAQIAGILGDYLGTITDEQTKLERHLKRRGSKGTPQRVEALYAYELDKYTYIYDEMCRMLGDPDSCTENHWQEKMLDFLLLLFPKYVAIFKSLHIEDRYSKPGKLKKREIDLTLVDYNGNIDILEIKKPSNSHLLLTRPYRDNYTPRRELSGSVMQAEKYLFYLNKQGCEGEKQINAKYKNDIPRDMKIKITNPKAMIVIGRDNDFDEQQNFDFEIIKRKYANIMDIITYDDLLRRLQNIMQNLKKKINNNT